MSNSILIIDDDKRLRELLEDYLLEKKFVVYLSDDFRSAKEILDDTDCIIEVVPKKYAVWKF